MKNEKAVTHAAVETALDILMAFVPHNPETGTTELASRMGLHKSTASRLLHTLCKKGFLNQNQNTKKFQLGPTILTIGTALKDSLAANLITIAKPHMNALRDTIGETISLEILSGTNTIIAHMSEGPARTKVAGNIGDILSLHAAAGAKAIIAFSPPDARKEILKRPFPKLTPNTITKPKSLEREWLRILQRGYSVDREEHDIGITAIGVPVFDNSGKPAAGLVVAGPTEKIDIDGDHMMVKHLKKTAEIFSKDLYHTYEEPA
jgi:DNA-binding IclR family transcriptional regulator